MSIKQALTRFLINRLPADEQADIAACVIAWRFADLSAAERQQRIDQFGLGLLQLMREGRVGLALLIFHHLLRLSPSRWLARRVASASRVYGKWSRRKTNNRVRDQRPPQQDNQGQARGAAG